MPGKTILKNICMLFFVYTAFISNSSIAANENTKLPMLLDFGADKCIPCQKMAPILEKMETQYKGEFIVKFTDVWKSENIKIAKQYDIKTIPTQIFFDENGKEIWRHVGFISEEDILAKWKSFGYDFSNVEKTAVIPK